MNRTRVARLVGLLALSAVVLGLASCAAAPSTPTVTAVALAATATPRPRDTRVPPTASAPPAATPTAGATSVPPSFAQLDDLSVERTVRGFLDRLAQGQADQAFRLYLTDAARQSEAGQQLSASTAAGASLASAEVLEVGRGSPATYVAHVLLSWRDGPATQPATLTLVPDRGLWLIDAIVLGERLEATPAPTPKAAARPSKPSLQGKLVFQASSGGSIYTVNADGTDLRRLTSGLDPAWSPDGKQVAVTRWDTPRGLFLVNPDGTERRVVDSNGLKEAAWSPDGTRLAFTSILFKTTEPVKICLPDGACFTLPPISLGEMWIAGVKTGHWESVPLGYFPIHAPSWSPQGDRIVYAGDRGLAWVDPGTSAQGRFPNGSAEDASPRYSPDGKTIVYMGRVHDRWEIWSMNADGTGRRQLTTNNTALKAAPSSVAPTWSPDGKQIAFLSDRDGLWRIYVMNADGSQQRSMFGAMLDTLGLRYEFASERVLDWTR